MSLVVFVATRIKASEVADENWIFGFSEAAETTQNLELTFAISLLARA
jgi:hypothetical protein